jgi:putative transposase
MPRSPRLDYPGARHHVMNKSPRRRKLFRYDSDLVLFRELLAELLGRFDCKVHGYALMSNHFHLMLQTDGAPLPKVMAWFSGALARKLNATHGWDGPIFRGRYRNRLVVLDDYWRDLLAYVHLNPVRARLVDHPEESVWTSHRAYAGLDPAPPWLARDELLDLYGSEAMYGEAIEELVAADRALPEHFSDDLLWRPPTTKPGESSRIPPVVKTLSAEEALEQVAAITEQSLERILTPLRGRTGNKARTLAAWWLVRAAGMSRSRAGRTLGMKPGAVGGAVHRVKRAEGELATWREALLDARWAPLAAGRPE